jgi:site-specific DNA-methyltransferase (adenine-specific)
VCRIENSTLKRVVSSWNRIADISGSSFHAARERAIGRSRTTYVVFAARSAADQAAISRSPERAASRTAEAVPSRGEEAPFFLGMFSIVTEFLLALDGNFDPGRCLSHVGTEGDGVITDPPYCSGGRTSSERQAAPSKKYLGGNKAYAEFLGDHRDQRGFLAWCSLWLAAALARYARGRRARGTGGAVTRPGSTGTSRSSGSEPLLAQTANSHALRKRPSCGRIVVPDGLVLDPFAGAGTTGLVALAEGRRFIGIELHPGCAAIARRRAGCGGRFRERGAAAEDVASDTRLGMNRRVERSGRRPGLASPRGGDPS